MEFYNCAPDELAHYGVLGMKWGVHRSKSAKRKAAKVRSLKKDLKKARSEADAAKEELAKRDSEATGRKSPNKTVRDMSDDDLRKAISRLQMERQYAELTRPPQKQKLFDGKKFVADVLTTQGKKLAGDIINYQAGKVINKAMGATVVNLKNSGNDDKKKDE